MASCVSIGPGGANRVRAGEAAPRVRAARLHQEAAVRRLFRAAGATYTGPVLIVAFKRERRLELWGYSAQRRRYVEIVSYPVLGTSGTLGPKRRAWDHQIPEGFYRVTALNPSSLYHLSLRLDYPNASDRVLGYRSDPGDDIYIHGDRVSDGCIPIGDRAIEQLYLAVLDSRAAGHQVPVEIFPCRFSDPGCRALLRSEEHERPELTAFWTNLEAGFDVLVRSGTPAVVSVGGSGRYIYLDGVSHARVAGRSR
jgi:murein L,D-transpeptidase YafK